MIDAPHRRDGVRIAALIHRVSGVGLALFLPVHFYVLGLALNDTAALDTFLNWTDNWAVKLAETGLVLLLSLHLFGGLRILALEFLPWTPRQKLFAALAASLAVFVSLGFFLSAGS
ncbi:MAG: succinate dehydrogenase [Alphaproteobacteria bacterium]|nr:succinate dehydrogenase [Alphaproteobacteria bacterium]